MGGFFGAVSREHCAADVFFGTDYHSHLGTHRGGMAFWTPDKGFLRSIHDISNSPFRTRFDADYNAPFPVYLIKYVKEVVKTEE